MLFGRAVTTATNKSCGHAQIGTDPGEKEVPHSASATLSTTSPASYSKQTGSGRNYTLTCDEQTNGAACVLHAGPLFIFCSVGALPPPRQHVHGHRHHSAAYDIAEGDGNQVGAHVVHHGEAAKVGILQSMHQLR